jgi:hypothetical protein
VTSWLVAEPVVSRIADTYRAYCEEMKASDSSIKQCPQDHDHATFDLTAVLYAARPDWDYFSLSKPGTISVLNYDGSRFQESDGGMHRYLVLSEEQKARTLEAMLMLASQYWRFQLFYWDYAVGVLILALLF